MICSLDFYRSEQSLNNDMMKYRLKSKYLQKRLDEISCGDFTERLQESVSKVAPCVVVTFGAYPGEGKHCRFMASFEHKEIEEIPALYDPTAWNEWPEVTPPLCEDMRVELQTKDGLRFSKTCAHFNGTEWETWKVEHWEDYIVRFRPWLSPYEEEKE